LEDRWANNVQVPITGSKWPSASKSMHYNWTKVCGGWSEQEAFHSGYCR
jgi:hypothetical protein